MSPGVLRSSVLDSGVSVPGILVLETGERFKGLLWNKETSVGEVVFNTSHSGYEEIATDPSYYNQILVMTAPLQGNYSANPDFWQSKKIWIKAFICLEIQKSKRDKKWLETLQREKVPVLSSIDTRNLVLRLRKKGVVWGVVLPLSKQAQAPELIHKAKKKSQQDWTSQVCVKEAQDFKGEKKKGLKLALIDFGYKENILKELLKRASVVRVFPSYSSVQSVKDFKPDALVLSNGPGDPQYVLEGTKLVKALVGWRPLFGICMGHQVLAQALGAKTYKLEFGHRGSNHPIKDNLLNRVYMSAQNHGYVVNPKTLNENITVSHINLNDGTVAGIYSKALNFLSVQFHPENKPGPTEALSLFDTFFKKIVKDFYTKNKQ